MLIGACGGSRNPPDAPTAHARGPAVARVGSGVIRQADLNHWMSTAGSRVGVTRKRMLSFLVRSRWLLEEARERAVRLPASEVKHQVAELLADQAEHVKFGPLPHEPLLRRLLLVSGLRPADRRWLMSLTLLVPRVERARLERARREVSRDRAEKFYARHRGKYFLPDQRQVEIIGGGKPLVLQAKREIERGKPFLDAAKVSLDPEAPGGLWRLIRGHDEPQVEDPIFAAKSHELVGPKQYSQYYIFEVLEAIPAHQQMLREVEGKIKEELAPSPQRVRSEAEREWVRRTTCLSAYVVPECSERHPGAVDSPRGERGR
jgi:hypothetical protein